MNQPSLSLLLTSIFSNGEQLSTFMSYLKWLQVAKNQFLFHQKEPSNGVYFILSGQVSSVIEHPLGKVQRLQTFGTGEIIGEGECYFDLPRTVSLIADQPSSLYHLSNQAWEKLDCEVPAIATELNKYLLGLLAIRLSFNRSSFRLDAPTSPQSVHRPAKT